jgi:DNA-binding response OmpR family regulator
LESQAGLLATGGQDEHKTPGVGENFRGMVKPVPLHSVSLRSPSFRSTGLTTPHPPGHFYWNNTTKVADDCKPPKLYDALMRVLLIEDFAPLREAIAEGLDESGFAVDAASNGEDGLRYANLHQYDVIVLDLMLPKVDGLTVLKTLRRTESAAHVLILTAKDTPEDRILGLDLGADDYLIKPFDFGELLARVRALVRRKYEKHKSRIRVADMEIDLSRRQVMRAGKHIGLSGREYALLEYLAFNVNCIVSRSDIWQHVYDFNASLESNVVDVFIGLLRKKIERPGRPRLLHTRRGQGYMLASLDEEKE